MDEVATDSRVCGECLWSFNSIWTNEHLTCNLPLRLRSIPAFHQCRRRRTMGGVHSTRECGHERFRNRGSGRSRRAGLPHTACKRLPSARSALYCRIQNRECLHVRVCRACVRVRVGDVDAGQLSSYRYGRRQGRSSGSRIRKCPTVFVRPSFTHVRPFPTSPMVRNSW